MNDLPDDTILNIFKHFTADSMNSILHVNIRFQSVANTSDIWKHVYKNTIPHRFIDTGIDDHKFLLQTQLSVLKSTDWFKRKLFLRFITEKIYVDITKTVTMNELYNSFTLYSNGKFNSFPQSWYWDFIENAYVEHIHILSNVIEYINIIDGCVNFSFPQSSHSENDNTTLVGIGVSF